MGRGFARVQLLQPWFHQLDPRPLLHVFWFLHTASWGWLSSPTSHWKGPYTAQDIPPSLACAPWFMA